MTDFIFLGSKITVDSDSSDRIKRCLFLERKAMANIASIWKSRDITLPTKVSSQSYSFSSSHVQIWELDHKVACQLMVLEKTREFLGQQGYQTPLEGLMLKLKLQYFGHLIRRADSLEKIPMLGKIEGRRRRGWQRMRWLDGIVDSVDIYSVIKAVSSFLKHHWWCG